MAEVVDVLGVLELKRDREVFGSERRCPAVNADPEVILEHAEVKPLTAAEGELGAANLALR